VTLEYPQTEKPVDRHVYYREDEEGLHPVLYDGRNGRYLPVTWTAQPGSQDAFLKCPYFEVMYEGNRGGGKTDCLLMDFAQHVGRGYGPDWKGVLFRRTYPELGDVISKSLRWFKAIFGNGARYNSSQHYWQFADGERLLFRHMKTEQDYWSYHGHSYPWQGWEELCTWPDDSCYRRMFSCARTTNPQVPIHIRSTANPYGSGHNWVKTRFKLPAPPNRIYGNIIKETMPNGSVVSRVAIHGSLSENRILLTADPNYIERLRQAARNESELKAWIHGDWDIVAGGMFDDCWIPDVHVIRDFDLRRLPKGWNIRRSYDHGQSKPASVGWWAESNGEPIEVYGRFLGTVKGDRIRIAEWYLWNGKPNEGLRLTIDELARGVKQREHELGIARRVKAGGADTSIFDRTEGTRSVASELQRYGVRFEPVDKSSGSRKQGWELMRKLMKGAIPANGVREQPGLFVLESCEQFRRTIPVLPRDPDDIDDVDTDAEDHVADETRYYLRHKPRESGIFSWK
jgi:hypothetical protein